MEPQFSGKNKQKLLTCLKDVVEKVKNGEKIPDSFFENIRNIKKIKYRKFPTSIDEKAVPVTKNNIKPICHEQITEERFWQTIATLRWADSDEKKYTKRYVHQKLNATSRAMVKNKMVCYSYKLHTAIESQSFVQDKSQEFLNNFCSHIIGKGKQFYKLALSTPDMTAYMLDKYQPLWDYLQE